MQLKLTNDQNFYLHFIHSTSNEDNKIKIRFHFYIYINRQMIKTFIFISNIKYWVFYVYINERDQVKLLLLSTKWVITVSVCQFIFFANRYNVTVIF